MTTPTQAQIEAAAKAIYWANANEQTRLDIAKAALTAAAQVEEYQKLGIDPTNPNPDGSDFHLMNAVDEIKNATIERCAQLVESFGGHNVPLIAAAIRKLRDEP